MVGMYWIGLAIFDHHMDHLRDGWTAILDDITWLLTCNEVSPPAAIEVQPDDVPGPSNQASPSKRKGSSASGSRKRARRT